MPIPLFLHAHVQSFWILFDRIRPYVPASFFVGGFGFDVLTLGRIDHWLNLLQQGLYLIIVGVLITLDAVVEGDEAVPAKLRKLWRFRGMAIHFLLGALLSVYSIFYFKSASAGARWIFLLPLVLVLILNEFERFQRLGVSVRFGLLSLSLSSYLVYLIPTLWGSVGLLPFLLASLLATVAFLTIFRLLRSRVPFASKRFFRMAGPAFAVQALFVGMYVTKVLPPVPLAIQEIGIYHHVEATQAGYELRYEHPGLKFWQKDARPFRAVQGDSIYCYFRVFSPTEFSDSVVIRWAQYLRGAWMETDAIAVRIRGGRAKGYRGYTKKVNYTPGRWRVTVETTDGRELTRLTWRVELGEDSPSRRWKRRLDG